MTRRLLTIAALSGLSVLAVSPALATNTDPHHEEADGCDHGATGKDCRPDPSDAGKDCEVHGNHGGVNEDHCVTTTTPSAPSETTTTTTQPVTTTTPPSTAPPTGSPLPPVSEPLLNEPPPSAALIDPLVIEQPGAVTPPPLAASAVIQQPAELPRTGGLSVALTLVGFIVLLSGISSLILAQLIRGAR